MASSATAPAPSSSLPPPFVAWAVCGLRRCFPPAAGGAEDFLLMVAGSAGEIPARLPSWPATAVLQASFPSVEALPRCFPYLFCMGYFWCELRLMAPLLSVGVVVAWIGVLLFKHG
nr:unnamed protein product [Digitaria exilis]